MTRLYLAVFLAGGALMGLEIAGSRVLAPVFGTSVFVWGALITTFLASLAGGYALGGKLADRRPEPAFLAAILSAAGALLWLLVWGQGWILEAMSPIPVPERFRVLLVALALFSAPSVLMGIVSPFATRLAAREIATVGSAAGRLSAISTAGSIAGTFSMTFFLIPAFPIRPILFGLGLTLLLAAALVRPLKAWKALLLDVAITAIAAFGLLGGTGPTASPLPGGTTVYEKETAYHNLRVVDIGRRRFLYFNNLTQGFLMQDPSGETSPNYTDGLLAAMAFQGRPTRSAVVIGLGAGMIPTLLSRRAPEIEVTSIELDPEVVAVARKYFWFVPDASDRILVGDGRRELALHVPSADVIFEDAYFADSAPFHLMTKEFFELSRDRLPGDGVFAANLVGALTGKENALFWSVYRTLKQVFPNVYILCPELAKGKKTFWSTGILVATRNPVRLDPGTISDRIEEVARRLSRPAIASWKGTLHQGEIPPGAFPILTDAYSPTDALQHFGTGRPAGNR